MSLGAKINDFHATGILKNGAFSGGVIELNMVAVDTCTFRGVDLSRVTNCEFSCCHFVGCVLKDAASKNRFVICHFVGMDHGFVDSMENCHVVG